MSDKRKKNVKVGFVPTMGALHHGHIQLVERCIDENDFTVVSIFVNQLQFNNKNDFENYPHTLEEDLLKLREIDCDAVYLPDSKEIYPIDFIPVKIDTANLNQVLEGPVRPGHFEGVIQVVNRFFEFIKPDNAYFGLKDYQQCQVVKALRNQLHPKINLHFCETIRSESGLALSSRNERLSDQGKVIAANIYKILTMIQRLSKHIEVKDALTYGNYLLSEKNIEIEYLELANAETLNSAKKWLGKGKNAVLIAAYVEGIRLIDNIVF